MKTTAIAFALSTLLLSNAHAGLGWETHARTAVETARLERDASRHALALVEKAMREASAAVAAYVVLECLFPEQEQALGAELAVSLAAFPETQAKADALALGRRTATELLRSSGQACVGAK